MWKTSLIFLLFLITNFSFASDKKYTQQEYVFLWKEHAINQMHEHNIPASITLAQGILESASGNSELARNANNHFGIKCSNWNGPTYFKEDNIQADCFRKYKNAKDSYEDHSLFLKKERYAFLYNYDIKDYKSWANGLKQAGYATNPKYPSLLIELIERLKLYEYDGLGSVKSHLNIQKNNVKQTKLSIQQHENNIQYVLAKKGDTFYRISKELNISIRQLYKYNDFELKKDCLQEGDVVFIQPKKNKSNIPYIVLKKEMNLYEISQKEGIKLKKLMKYNKILSPEEPLEHGTKIILNKKFSSNS